MFPQNDLGAALYATWTDEQRHEEISRLVDGFRSGLPAGILCKMTETIAGNQEKGKEILLTLLTREEREAAVSREQGGMRIFLQEMLLAEQ
jgi:hypothetical protein